LTLDCKPDTILETFSFSTLRALRETNLSSPGLSGLEEIRGWKSDEHAGASETSEAGIDISARRWFRTVLICHEGAVLDQEGLARWLASFSALTGIVVLREQSDQIRRRIRREIERVGPWRFLDVLAFRLYDRLFLASANRRWEEETLQHLRDTYVQAPASAPLLYTHSANSAEAEQFIRQSAPDLMIARCKQILKERIFSIPRIATLVMHPGICPEYRNAHGCFWALANDDLKRVGMTLLKIDKGVDTGPVFGYYSYPFDEVRESPSIIHHRVVLDNLPALATKLTEIVYGSAVPLDTSGRKSSVWGQPRLTSYLVWKRKARRRAALRG
jgi:folate-dependent phosphoribosylglycinamide formyltransferase PurN